MKFLKRIGLYFLLILFFCTVVLYSVPSRNLPSRLPSYLLFAHKAISNKFPENSIESIVYLKSWGVKAIEIDLRKTADDTWVLFHDSNGKTLLRKNVQIKELTFNELEKLNLYLNEETVCKVPSFDSVLERIQDSVYLYLDIKIPSFQNAKEIAEIIEKHHLNNTLIVASTDGLLILYLKIFYPEIHVALEGFNSGKEFTYPLTPKRLRPDFLSGFYFRTNLRHVSWLRKHQLLDSKIVYGVDTASIEKVTFMGYKKIMADFDSTMFVRYQNER
jgi:glycerophosphoryl diester phosphodiesterase